MTVFIRNAANLAHILPKTSRTTFTSEVFLQVQALNRAFQMHIANFFFDFLTKFQKFHSPKELKYLRGDLTKVSLHRKQQLLLKGTVPRDFQPSVFSSIDYP
jgi:hypothetical protein